MAEARGDRYNAGKWVPSFWPREPLEAAARVWEFGAKKYERDNWKGGMPWTEVADCALRHIHAWLDGEDQDQESGLNHIWHALCNLAMLAWFIRHRPDLDNRHVSSETMRETCASCGHPPHEGRICGAITQFLHQRRQNECGCAGGAL